MKILSIVYLFKYAIFRKTYYYVAVIPELDNSEFYIGINSLDSQISFHKNFNFDNKFCSTSLENLKKCAKSLNIPEILFNQLKIKINFIKKGNFSNDSPSLHKDIAIRYKKEMIQFSDKTMRIVYNYLNNYIQKKAHSEILRRKLQNFLCDINPLLHRNGFDIDINNYFHSNTEINWVKQMFDIVLKKFDKNYNVNEFTKKSFENFINSFTNQT